MNMILSVLRMVRIYNAKIVLPVIWVFIFIGNVYSSELKQPREGDIYQTSRGEFVIKILSSRQLEFAHKGAVMVAEYTVDGDSMRLTFDNEENKRIEYYKIISVGLKGDKDTLSGMVLYDKNITDSFFNAVKERNINEVKSLLSKGVDPNYVNEYGESALLFAIMAGDAEVVRKLLSAGADPDSKDTHGTPVLTLASDEGYLDIVKVLLEVGADVNKKDNDGSTALMEAAEKDHIDIVKILLDAGADPNVE
ncbi:MAG: ankyrin repeat domain-containing protein, partial [Nitrospinota bacterium]